MKPKRKTEPDQRGRSQALLVRGARQLLTLRGANGPRRGREMAELRIIVDGALLIKDGVIAEVGPSRRVERLADARDAHEIDASGKVVIPGFVDASTRLLSPAPALDDYEIRCLHGEMPGAFQTGSTVPPAIKAMRGYSAQWMELEGRRRLRYFWRNGTTTLNATSGFGLDEACELRTLRVLGGLRGRPLDIVCAYGGADAVAPEFAGRTDEYIDWMIGKMLPLIRKRRLADSVSIRVGPAAFAMEQARRFLAAATELGFVSQVNLDADAHAEALPCRAVVVTSRCPDPVIGQLAAGGALAILTPGAEFLAGRPAVNARALVDSGAAVALASDYGSGAGPTPSMPAILSLACARNGLSPAEAICAATINSACALGVNDRAGSLEAGKDADVLLVQTGDYREIPFHLGLNLVAGVMKRGEMIFPRMEPA